MDASIALTRHRLDVAAVERMAEAGIFGHEDRIELLDGELIDMAPIGEPHAALVAGLTQALVLALGKAAIVWPHSPVMLDKRNLPQPDLAVLRYRADFYASTRPGPADILLLVEVADSSIRFDRGIKLPLYARAGIAELWIVDVQRRVLEAYRDPTGDRYATLATHRNGDTLSLALAPDIAIRLDLSFGDIA